MFIKMIDRKWLCKIGCHHWEENSWCLSPVLDELYEECARKGCGANRVLHFSPFMLKYLQDSPSIVEEGAERIV